MYGCTYFFHTIQLNICRYLCLTKYFTDNTCIVIYVTINTVQIEVSVSTYADVYLQYWLQYRFFFSMGPAKAANYCKQMQSNVLIHKAATAYQEAL